MGIVDEYPVGSRVAHSNHGAGTVVGHELVDPLRPSSHRVGVVFDTHTLFAKPAYFFHDELTKHVEASMEESVCKNVVDGQDCSSMYNCCDCGGAGCGCSGCFSCRACSSCLPDHGDDE